MKRAHETLRRLYWIDAALRDEEKPGATRLAADLGVSRGTICRDMARLRDEFKAPIIFDPSTKIFVYGRAFVPELPDLPFDEALALGRALRRRASLAGTALEMSLRRQTAGVQALLAAPAPASAPGPTPAPRPAGFAASTGRRARARLGERIGPGTPADEPLAIKLRFDASVVSELLEQGFLRRRDVQLLTDGGVEAEVTTRDPDALLLDLLRWAPHFEIAGPAWIRRRLPALLRGLLRRWEPRRPRRHG